MAVSAVHVFQVLEEDFKVNAGKVKHVHVIYLLLQASNNTYIKMKTLRTPDKQQVKARLNNDGLLCTHAAHYAQKGVNFHSIL